MPPTIAAAIVGCIALSGLLGVEAVPAQALRGSGDGCVLPSYGFTVPITVTNTNPALSNYAVLVTLDTATPIGAGKMQLDCDDIRFVDSFGTILDHWMEWGCNTATTSAWVEVPSLVTGSTQIYLQYGNPAAAGSSSGSATFPFFEDFADGLAGWTAGGVNINDLRDSYSNTADPATSTSPPSSARTRGDASCFSSPFDGAGAVLSKTDLGLPAGDYSLDFDSRIEITGFEYFSGLGSMYRIVRVNGTTDVLGSVVCGMGLPCPQLSDWTSFRRGLPSGTAPSSLELEGYAGDCVDGNVWWDNVRIRKCQPGTEPTAVVGGESLCSSVAVPVALTDADEFFGGSPSPFTNATRLSYQLKQASRVRLSIYDIEGKLVVGLLDAERPGGSHSVVWDGRMRSGRTVPAGVYFVRFESAGETRTRRVVRVTR